MYMPVAQEVTISEFSQMSTSQQAQVKEYGVRVVDDRLFRAVWQLVNTRT